MSQRSKQTPALKKDNVGELNIFQQNRLLSVRVKELKDVVKADAAVF
jgi:hypothetical protein